MKAAVFHQCGDASQLEQAREAYARYERGEQFGKIVLKIRE